MDIYKELSALLCNKSGLNRLTPVQEIYLTMLLEQHTNYKDAMKAIKTDGLITISDGRHGEIKKAHPAIDAGDRSMKAIINLIKELDLAPGNVSRKDAEAVVDGKKKFDTSKRPGG